MPKFIKELRIERIGGQVRILADGQEFPWHVGTVLNSQISQETMPSVTLELFAERIQIIDDVNTPPKKPTSGPE